jgi:hypothetical protein
MRYGPPALCALVIVAGLGAACSTTRSSAEDIQGVRDELVTFRSKDATLSGTLFLPAGGDRHPAVDAGDRAFSIVVFPGADHVMTVPSAEGGRTLAPGYLATMADWLRTNVNR